MHTIGEPEPCFYFTRHFDYLVIVFIDGSVASHVWCFLALEHSQQHMDTLSFLLCAKVPCTRADVPRASPALQDSRASPMISSHWALIGCMCGLSVHQVPLPTLLLPDLSTATGCLWSSFFMCMRVRMFEGTSVCACM